MVECGKCSNQERRSLKIQEKVKYYSGLIMFCIVMGVVISATGKPAKPLGEIIDRFCRTQAQSSRLRLTLVECATELNVNKEPELIDNFGIFFKDIRKCERSIILFFQATSSSLWTS